MAAQTFSTGGPKAAARSNTSTGTGRNVSERESLADYISMITRDETPFLASIPKGKPADSIQHEWQTDELAPPVHQPAPEGVSYDQQKAAQAVAPDRVRLQNYTQINSKTIEVTNTKNRVKQAGVRQEYAYQLQKRGKELRRDQEFSVVQAWTSSDGSTATRVTGGYQAWANYTEASPVSGAPGTMLNVLADPSMYVKPTNEGAGITGTFTAAVGNPDRSSLQLSHIDEVMQRIYENGGKATRMMTSPSNKRAFSSRSQSAGSFTSSDAGDGNVRRTLEGGKLVQNVELYESDFGTIMVVPNYIMAQSYTGVTNLNNMKDFCAFVYDPSWWGKSTLRPLTELPIAQAGDSNRGQIVEEWALQCNNPRGSGLVIGLNGQ